MFYALYSFMPDHSPAFISLPSNSLPVPPLLCWTVHLQRFGFGMVFHVYKSRSLLTCLLKTTLLFLKVLGSGWERGNASITFNVCMCVCVCDREWDAERKSESVCVCFWRKCPDPRKRHWLESFHSCNSFPSNTYCTVTLSFPPLSTSVCAWVCVRTCECVYVHVCVCLCVYIH